MTEVIAPNGAKDPQIEELKAQINELSEKNKVLEAKVATETEGKTAAVGELKDNRIKMGEMKAKLEALEKGNQSEPNVDEAVATALAKRDKEKADTNKASALENFVKAHKEFLPENDPTGLKLTAFKQKVARFNTEGLTETEQFMEVLGDAYRLLTNTNQQTKTPKVTTSTPSSADEPEEIVTSQLSEKEKKVITRLGWTEEKYLELKKKQPAYIARILRDF